MVDLGCGLRLAVRSLRRSPVALLVLLGPAIAAPGGAAVALLAADGAGGGGATAVVTYLANEGVLIAAGGDRVLVDALFGDGLAGYAVVPPAQRAELEAARGEYSGVDLLLATHAHPDHFDAAAVARHLTANPGALFVSSSAAVDAVLARPGGATLAGRLRAVHPAEGGSDTVRHRGLDVTVYPLHHGRDSTRPVANLGFLVEIGGRRILHVGDTEATAEELAATGLAERGVDLALVPFWRLLDDRGRAAVRDAIAPGMIAAFHLPTPEAPADWWGIAGGLEGVRRAVAADFPGAVLFAAPGASMVVTPRSTGRTAP